MTKAGGPLTALLKPGAEARRDPDGAYSVYADDRRFCVLPDKLRRSLLEGGGLVDVGRDGRRLRLSEKARDALNAAAASGKADSGRTENAIPAEGPLLWLRTRKGPDGEPLITARQFEAGERLRADYEKSQMRQSVTSDWLRMPEKGVRGPSDGLSVSETALAARDRLAAALSALTEEQGVRSVVFDVCCHAVGLEEMERRCRLPQRSGKVVLIIGLTDLAKHYGLKDEGGRGRVQSWTASGARPSAFPEDEDAA